MEARAVEKGVEREVERAEEARVVAAKVVAVTVVAASTVVDLEAVDLEDADTPRRLHRFSSAQCSSGWEAP